MMWSDTLPMDQPLMQLAQEKTHVLRLIMQLRSSGVRDSAVLSAMEHVPRELFISSTFGHRAYDDTALPIECGQTISQPAIVGLMTQALELNDRHRVLEIGTGSGYQAAVLSKIVRMVYTIERHRELYQISGARFDQLRCRNIMRQCADGALGWPEAAPFDRILLTAAASEIPPHLREQLNPEGGMMILPVGEESNRQTLIKLVRQGEEYTETALMPVRFVPLVSEGG